MLLLHLLLLCGVAHGTKFGVEFNQWPLGACNVLPFAVSAGFTAPSGSPAPVDADGWPTTDAYSVLFDYASQGYDPLRAVPASIWGTYTVSFDGRGVVTLFPGLGVVLNSTFDAATYSTLAFVSLTDRNNTPGLVIGVYDSTRADGSSGFTNLRVLQPGCALSATPFFTPNVIAAIAPFSHIRMHEYFGTNTVPVSWPVTAAWADRRLLSDVFYASGAGGKPRAVGAPWETALLASHAAVEKPIWLNIPVYASDDFVVSLAALLRTGSSALGITGFTAPVLYVEHANEVWLNTSDAPPNYAYNLAAAIGEVGADPASPLASGGETDPIVWAHRRHAKRLREISITFTAAFAGSSTRVCAVFAWMQSYSDEIRASLQWLEETYGAGEAARVFCGIAVNAYHGPGSYPEDAPPLADFATVDDVLAGVLAATDASRAPREATNGVAVEFGLALMVYEGAGWPLPSGAGFNGVGFNATVASIIQFNRQNASAEAEMYDIATGWPADSLSVFNFYSLSSPFWEPPSWGSLGLCEDVGFAFESPKYRGALAIIQSHGDARE